MNDPASGGVVAHGKRHEDLGLQHGCSPRLGAVKAQLANPATRPGHKGLKSLQKTGTPPRCHSVLPGGPHRVMNRSGSPSWPTCGWTFRRRSWPASPATSRWVTGGGGSAGVTQIGGGLADVARKAWSSLGQ
jgi:hypothetical protein